MYVNRRAVISGVAAITLVGLTAGCGDSAPTEGGAKVFRIAAIAPLTGDLAAAGAAVRCGLEAAVAHVNATGGIDGRQAEITFADDKGDPATAVTVTSDLLAKGKPDLLIPGAFPNDVVAVVPLASRAKVLSITSSSAAQVADAEKYPFFFSTSVTPEAAEAAVVSHLKANGITKAAMISTSDASGQSNVDAFEAETTKAGLEHSVAQFKPTQIDVTAELSRLRADNPQVLVLDAFGANAAAVLNARAKLDWDIPVLGSARAAASNLAALATPDQLDGVQIVAPRVVVQSRNEGQAVPDLVKAVQGKCKIEGTLLGYGGAWDILVAVKAAAESAKSTDSQKLVEALQSLPSNTEFVTVEAMNFTAQRHTPGYTTDDFSVIAVTPLTGGQYTSQDSK